MRPGGRTFIKRIWYRLEEVFGIDLRSLAFFRVGLSLILLFDLAIRATSLRAHYTDDGILPRYALLEKFNEVWHVSLHLMSGTLLIQAILFLLAGIAAIALLVGYRTSLATCVSWVLLISLHSRNGIILQGGDVLLRMLVFWSMFLPLGACYSVDATLNSSPPQNLKRVTSMGTIAILFQVCIVYAFTAILKKDPVWVREGTAVYYALSLDQFVTPFGKILWHFPRFLKGITFSTLYLEKYGFLLAFIPFYHGFFRTLVVFLFVSFHLGLGLSMELGPFPYICAVAWSIFLPTAFWDNVLRMLRTPQRVGLRLYYDRDCGFCRKTVYLLKTFFLFSETRLLPAQEDRAIFAEMEKNNSWVVVDAEKKHHYRFDGFLALCRGSVILWPLGIILRRWPFYQTGDRLYRWVASHRQWGGRITTFLKERPLSIRLPDWKGGVAFFFLVYILCWNIRTLDFNRYQRYFPRKVNWVGMLFRVDQMWNMFSPKPLTEDGWYVIPGTLQNKTEVDLFRKGAPVTWEKPVRVEKMYAHERWRKYMMNLWSSENSTYRPYYAQYLCRDWNAHHKGEQHLQKVQIYFMREDTLPDYQIPPPKKVLLWEMNCVD